jgi:HSP20 family protein
MTAHRNVRRLEVRTAASHGRAVHESFSSQSCWSPAINVYERPDAVVVCVDLAGVQRHAVEVTVQPGRLCIAGERPAPEPPRPDPTHHVDPAHSAPPAGPLRIRHMEIDYGRFERRLPIPDATDLDRVASAYADGILTITLPRRTPR